MTDGEQDPSRDMADASAALVAFLHFRETDLQLWRRAGASLGLSAMAMLALARILRADREHRPLRQVDLSGSLELSAAGTSTIVTALEERGLVRRVPSPTDRRAVHLVPGDDSELIVEELLAADEFFLRLAGEVSPEGLRGFLHIMTGMRALSARKFPVD